MNAGIFGVGINDNQPIRLHKVDCVVQVAGSKVSWVASMGDLAV